MTIETVNPNAAMTCLEGLTELLVDAVEHGASVGFLPPVLPTESLAFWQQTIRELGTGHRVLVAALENGKVVGSVQLNLAQPKDGQHRAQVEKLFVHTSQRGKGYGRLLMEKVEIEARSRGKQLLVLDTKSGDGAAILCEKLGYQRAGEIPGYAKQTDGEFSTVGIYFKSLD